MGKTTINFSVLEHENFQKNTIYIAVRVLRFFGRSFAIMIPLPRWFIYGMDKIVRFINRLRYRFLIWKSDRALMKQKKQIGQALLPAMKELLKQIESRKK